MADSYVAEGSTTITAPGVGENVYFLGGNAAVVTGVDLSGVADIARIEVSRAFTGSIGTSGNPLYCEVASALIYAAQSGSMYYRAKDGAGEHAVLVRVCGGGHFHAVTDGTFDKFEILSGTATIEGPIIATTISTAGGSLTILDDTSTDPTTLQLLSGGSVYTERGGTTFTVMAGTLAVEAGTNTVTTFNCYGPPTNARTYLTECGTITTLNAYGHIPDTTKMVRPLTITNTNINMSLPGAQAFLDNPLITFTNAATRFITDGRTF